MDLAVQMRHDELQKEIGFLLGEIAWQIYKIKTRLYRTDSRLNLNEIHIMTDDGLGMLNRVNAVLIKIADFTIQIKKQAVSSTKTNNDGIAEFSCMLLLNESLALLKDQSQGLSNLLIRINSTAEMDAQECKEITVH